MTGKQRVQRIRAFNRFYTRMVGALDEGHLASAYSLAEVRVLFELAHRERPTATELGRELGLDAGYLSRLLAGLVRRKLVKRITSAEDARQAHLELTATGRAAVSGLEQRAGADVARWLAPLDEPSQKLLVDAMERIQSLLGTTPTERVPY